MKPAMAAVLAALDAAIVAELASPGPGRYVMVAKLCGHADKLRMMCIERVSDVQKDDRDELDIGENEGVAMMNPARPFLGRRLGVGNDYDLPIPNVHMRLPGDPLAHATDMVREVRDLMSNGIPAREKSTMDMLDIAIMMRAQLLAPTKPGDGAAGDRAATVLPAALEAIDRRIEQLSKTLDQETASANDSGVVHSQLLRGHQGGSGQRDDVQGDHDRAHVEGGGGDRQPRGDGGEEGVAAPGGQAVLERDDAAAGADREGVEGTGEDPEARTDGDLGGEVHRRDDGGGSVWPFSYAGID